ncbi:unnamed protein product [Bemisia tabaci]|uniref:Uncharacterized protein n=1 Tax=Bemisia tabaci TaxID=7038 RepID=A0A9P0AI48_BEMTA|nr:unnamed protein product [Bemisia tabaci]
MSITRTGHLIAVHEFARISEPPWNASDIWRKVCHRRIFLEHPRRISFPNVQAVAKKRKFMLPLFHDEIRAVINAATNSAADREMIQVFLNIQRKCAIFSLRNSSKYFLKSPFLPQSKKKHESTPRLVF